MNLILPIGIIFANIVLIYSQTDYDDCFRQFKCEIDGNCIPISYTCDNHDDCGDNSDERDCPGNPILQWFVIEILK